MVRFLRVLPTFLYLLFGLIATGDALSPEKNRFTYPVPGGPNPVWRIGEKKVIAWKTELEVYNITFWHEYPTFNGATISKFVYSATNKDDPKNFTWTVGLEDFDLSFSNVFFFWFNHREREGFISHYFNITNDPITTSSTSAKPTSTSTTTSTAKTQTTLTTSDSTSSSTSTSTETPTSTSTSTSASISTSTTTTPVQSPLEQSTPAPEQQNRDLTPGAKVGLGIGIGIGVPIIALLAFIALSRHFVRSKPQDFEKPPLSPQMLHTPDNALLLRSKTRHSDHNNPIELDGRDRRMPHLELDSPFYK